MKVLELVREDVVPGSTLGCIALPRGPVLYTLERPWIPSDYGPGGKRYVSCIPEGEYYVRPHSSEKWPAAWALINPVHGVFYQPSDIPPGQAWGRTAILIHPANVVDELAGCIAPGIGRVPSPGGGFRLERSREALEQLTGYIGPGAWRLVVSRR